MKRVRATLIAFIATITAVGASATEKDPESWSLTWNNGTVIERNDGYHKIKIGGRIQTDFAIISESESLMRLVGGNGSGVEFRRARIFTEGTLFDKVIFKGQYDFADQDVDWKDVYVGLKKPCNCIDKLKIGHFKEPFSLEELTSSKYLTFMERALPNVFAPSRNTGIAVNGTQFDERMTWAAGGFRDVDDSGGGFSSEGMYQLTGRVTGLPLYQEGGRKLVHFGLGYTHQFRDMASLRYATEAEAHLGEDYVDTDASPHVLLDGDGEVIPAIAGVESIDKLGVELAWGHGPFSLQGEYMASWVDRSGAGDLDFWGVYGMVSYFLTGEHRPYKTSSATFSRVKPKKNFDPSKGDWGAWQLAFRYSYLDLEDMDIRGGSMSDITAAVNWYLFPNLRFMANYTFSNPMSDAGRSGTGSNSTSVGKANIFQMRASFDF